MKSCQVEVCHFLIGIEYGKKCVSQSCVDKCRQSYSQILTHTQRTNTMPKKMEAKRRQHQKKKKAFAAFLKGISKALKVCGMVALICVFSFWSNEVIVHCAFCYFHKVITMLTQTLFITGFSEILVKACKHDHCLQIWRWWQWKYSLSSSNHLLGQISVLLRELSLIWKLVPSHMVFKIMPSRRH